MTDTWETIVRDLAASDPEVEVMTDYDASELRCFHCGNQDDHLESCVWRRAREMTT